MRKLEVGVQSGNWYDEQKPEEGMKFIRSCGFEGIDYNINNLFSATFDSEALTSFFDRNMEELLEYFRSLKETSKEHGVSISQIHGLFPMYYPGQEEKNAYLIQVTEKMMAVCHYLDCRYIVIHPWTGPELEKERARQVNLSLYRSLIPAAKKYGVTICLENMFTHVRRRCIEGACTNAEETCWYILNCLRIMLSGTKMGY